MTVPSFLLPSYFLFSQGCLFHGMVCLLVLAVNSTQPRISWEENLNEKLSRLDWPLGMPMGNCLWYRKTTHPVVGGTIFQARNPKREES